MNKDIIYTLAESLLNEADATPPEPTQEQRAHIRWGTLIRSFDSNYDYRGKSVDELLGKLIELANELKVSGADTLNARTADKNGMASKATNMIETHIRSNLPNFKRADPLPPLSNTTVATSATSANTSAAETSAAGTSGTDGEQLGIMKNWPKYKEFRQHWYMQTVKLGWPKDIAPHLRVLKTKKGEDAKDTNDDPILYRQNGIVFPWSDKDINPYCFNSRGTGIFGSLRNYTAKIRDALYTKFGHDLRGLKALAAKVGDIIEVEKTYFKSRSMRSFIGNALIGIFRGIGATHVDEQMLTFLSKKFSGMTIFEYQEMILTEMIAKMEVSDDTQGDLKNILYPLRKIVTEKLPTYTISKVVVEYNVKAGYIAKFNVDTPPGTNQHSGKCFYDLMDKVVKLIINNDKSVIEGDKFDKTPSKEEFEKMMSKIKAVIDSGNTRSGAATIEGDVIPVEFIKYKYDTHTEKKMGEFLIKFNYLAKKAMVIVSYKPEDI